MSSKYILFFLFLFTSFISICFAQGWATQNSRTAISLQDVTFIDDNNGWAVGYGAILHTTNGGITWINQRTGSYEGVSFTDIENGWVVGWGISHTTNGGTTWVNQMDNSTFIAVTFINSSLGWAVGQPSIYHTTNGGANWSYQAEPGSDWYNCVAFIDSNRGWAAGAGQIVHTTNGGNTWTIQSGTYSDYKSIAFADSLNGWIVGTGGVILHTTNGGTSWNNQISGTNSSLNGVSFTNNLNGWIVGASGTTLQTTNGGTTWLTFNNATTNCLWDVSFINPNHGWAVGDGGTILRYYSTHLSIIRPNGREKFFRTACNTIQWWADTSIHRIVIEANRYNPDIVWDTIATNITGTTNFSWTPQGTSTTSARLRIISSDDSTITDTSDNNFSIKDICIIHPVGGERLRINSPDSILWWADTAIHNVTIELNRSFPGSIWETIATNLPNTGYYIWTPTGTYTNSARIRIGETLNTAIGDTSDTNFVLWGVPTVIRPNGGENFVVGNTEQIRWNSEGLTGNICIYLTRVYPVNSWNLLATRPATENSYSWFVNGPATTNARIVISMETVFTNQDTSNANFTISYPNEATTFNTHIFQFYINDAHPNPFNSTTHISFSLPTASQVKLTIYDALGREVKTIVNEKMNPGYHNAEWNAIDYSSGVYFVRMNAGNYNSTKKIALLR